LADIHRLSSEERRIYLSDAKLSCADEESYSIMRRSKRARMDDYDEVVSSSSHNSDIFDSDDEKEKEHSSEEESNSEENENSEEDDSKEESEDGEH
jgi:hypothetical protein